MNNKTLFTCAVNYIDENITKSDNDILVGVARETACSLNKFCDFFSLLTKKTLKSYIRERRLYWAAWELKFFPDKSIADIALSYGYSEQSSFTRAISSFYDATPMDIRSGKIELQNNKADFQIITNPSQQKSTLKYVFEKLDSGVGICGYASDILCKYTEAQHNYPFCPQALSAIFDLSEILSVPVEPLLEACLSVYAEAQNNPYENVSERNYEIASVVECGAKSIEEMREMCQFFDCYPVDLDSGLAEFYRNRKSDKSPLTDSENNYVDPS